jgi:hypothetical protein
MGYAAASLVGTEKGSRHGSATARCAAADLLEGKGFLVFFASGAIRHGGRRLNPSRAVSHRRE